MNWGHAMKRFTPQIWIGSICLLFCAACGGLQGKGKQPQMIQILLEINSDGKTVPMLIDAKANKIPLTLGTLMSAIAESAMMNGTSISPSTLDPHTIAMVKVAKEFSGVKTYFVGVKNQYDPSGREEPLNLGCLLSGAAVAYPGCTVDQMNGKSIDIKLNFGKDNQGKLQCYYSGRSGNEDFNLGVLIRASTVLLNNCEIGQ